MNALTRIAAGTLCALVPLCAAPLPAVIGGPDPQQIADRCIREANGAAEHRMSSNHASAAHCSQAIKNLVRGGHEDEAEAMTLHCIDSVSQGSHDTATAIQHGCDQCIAVLLDLDAPKLAAEVQDACRLAVQAVDHSRQAAVHAIKMALVGGPSTGNCPCDLDASGGVGGQDLAIVIGAWGTALAPADLDGDGTVAFGDLVTMLGAWGHCR